MSVDVGGAQVLEGAVQNLTELIAGLVGTAAKVRLYKSSFSPGPGKVYADFLAAEADFVGYSSVALTFAAVGVDAAGNAISYANRADFQATDGTTPNTIGGAWISVETATTPTPTFVCLRYFPFVTPIPMNVALATIAAVVMYQADNLLGKCIIDN